MWTGKTSKAHVSFDVGTLGYGKVIYVNLFLTTDINPGNQQEYSSEEPTTLNSGATAKGLLDGHQVSA